MAKWSNYANWLTGITSKLPPDQLALLQEYWKHGEKDQKWISAHFNTDEERWRYREKLQGVLEKAGFSPQDAETIMLVGVGVNNSFNADVGDIFSSGTIIGGSDALDSRISNITPPSGATVDTSKGEEDRQRLQKFIDAMQQQAATGGGAWEAALEQGKQTSLAQNASLAQTMQAGNPAAAMQAMQQAQAGTELGANAAEVRLREQSKQKAQDLLTSVESGQQDVSAAEAEAKAAAKQAAALAQNEKLGAQNKQASGMVSGGAQAVGTVAAMSDGGPVPGKAKVFGDDEANDTVPAMLSPGEIVIPRSVAQQPDAARKAAHFVAAVKAKGGKVERHADGGESGVPTTFDQPEGEQAGGGIDWFWAPAPRQHALSEKYGSLLEKGPYEQARAAALASIEQGMGARALGGGASMAPLLGMQQRDAAGAAALRAGVGSRGLAGLASSGGQGAQTAEMMGAQKAAEQLGGLAGATSALRDQQMRDLMFAKAQQQAAWRNSMANMGMSLAQQQAMMGLLGSAGQGAMTLAGSLGKGGGSKSPSYQEFQGPPPPAWEEPGTASAGEWAQYPGESASPSKLSESDGEGFAKGGMVKKRQADFLRAMRAHQ